MSLLSLKTQHFLQFLLSIDMIIPRNVCQFLIHSPFWKLLASATTPKTSTRFFFHTDIHWLVRSHATAAHDVLQRVEGGNRTMLWCNHSSLLVNTTLSWPFKSGWRKINALWWEIGPQSKRSCTGILLADGGSSEVNGCLCNWTRCVNARGIDPSPVSGLPNPCIGMSRLFHAALTSRWAYWSTWADCLEMIAAAEIQVWQTWSSPRWVRQTQGSMSVGHLKFVNKRWELGSTFLNGGTCERIAPTKPRMNDMWVGIPTHGWQHDLTEAVPHLFNTTMWPRLRQNKLWSGHTAARWQESPFTCFFVNRESHLRLPSPPSSWNCLCGLPTWLSWLSPQIEVLGRQGYALESNVGRVWETNARVSTNVMMRDMDPKTAPDTRRLEVVADGLPLHHGAQLAIDTTMVSPLRRNGASRPEHNNGWAPIGDTQSAEGKTVPRVIGPMWEIRIVVLAYVVGGQPELVGNLFLSNEERRLRGWAMARHHGLQHCQILRSVSPQITDVCEQWRGHSADLGGHWRFPLWTNRRVAGVDNMTVDLIFWFIHSFRPLPKKNDDSSEIHFCAPLFSRHQSLLFVE